MALKLSDNDSSQNTSSLIRVVWRIISFMALLVTPIGISTNLLEYFEGIESKKWESTNAKILRHSLYRSDDEKKPSHVFFEFSYEWDNRNYTGNYVSTHSSNEYTGPEIDAILEKYPDGKITLVYVCPYESAYAILEPGESRKSISNAVILTIALFPATFIYIICTYRFDSATTTEANAVFIYYFGKSIMAISTHSFFIDIAYLFIIRPGRVTQGLHWNEVIFTFVLTLLFVAGYGLRLFGIGILSRLRKRLEQELTESESY